jgi:hypothetical protein
MFRTEKEHPPRSSCNAQGKVIGWDVLAGIAVFALHPSRQSPGQGQSAGA